MKTAMLLSLALSFPSLAAAQRAEMYLAGGALKICSSLATGACRSLAPSLRSARQPARYRIDDAGIDRALAPELWNGRDGAPSVASLRLWLTRARMVSADSLDADALSDHLDAICISAGKARSCGRDSDDIRPWRNLLDDERAAVLAALEIPAPDAMRPREVVDLDASRNGDGVAILRAFVASAAERSGGRRPRVAFVTASAIDPYDGVDFYASALQAAGADPVWWPVDSALEAAVFGDEDCDALPALRLRELRLPQRERIFPDLVAEQMSGCNDRARLAAVPADVQGIFFAGGDQWRLRQVFFDDKDQANPWLLSLRAAFDAGGLVVGGTSAGTAVQSGGAMISNGSPERAMSAHARAGAPPVPGCERAQRCGDGIDEDDVSYWPAGGLALLPTWVIDTHFSQRDREPRLLRLMADTGASLGLGVDETSAVHLIRDADGTLTLEALGSSGAWLFEHDAASTIPNKISATVSFLAPGRRVSGSLTTGWDVSGETSDRCIGTAATDSGRSAPLRAAAWALAGDPGARPVSAGALSLSRTELTRTWRSPSGLCGVTRLQMDLTHPTGARP